ncbi:histone deacetylase family protein, partial [Pseudomonas sp. MWU13-2860]
LDVDYHHGNGGQSIFYQRDDVMFLSLHGDPKSSYPYFSGHRDEAGAGAGLGFNHNYPLPHGTGWPAYGEALRHACGRVAAYAPDALLVEVGVDVFQEETISQIRLDSEDCLRLGESLGGLGLTTPLAMEGGYVVVGTGVNAVNGLRGL